MVASGGGRDSGKRGGRRREPRQPDPGTVDRERRLRCLQADLTTFRASLAAIRAESRKLAEIEAAGSLTKDERQRLREIRWESERLRYEIQRIRTEFSALQHYPPVGPRPPSDGGPPLN